MAAYEKIVFEGIAYDKISKITIIIEPPIIEPPIPEYKTLKIYVNGEGTTDPANEVKYLVGSKFTIIAIPADKWLFKDWTFSWLPDLRISENPLVLTL